MALLHLFLQRVHIISPLLPSPSLQCLPPPHLLISSFHNVSDKLSFICFDYVAMSCQTCFLTFFAMSTTSHLRITCPYYLYLTFLYFLTLLISSSHNISDKLSFISFDYVSISCQTCFLTFSAMSTTSNLLMHHK